MASPRTVGAYMTRSPVTVQRSTSMAKALKLIEEHGFRHLPVLDGERLCGLVSERDLRVVENMRGIDSAFYTPAPAERSPTPLVAYVVTRASHKRQALGQLVLAQSLASLRQAGYAEARAVITAENLPSEQLFGRLGFTRIEEPA